MVLLSAPALRLSDTVASAALRLSASVAAALAAALLFKASTVLVASSLSAVSAFPALVLIAVDSSSIRELRRSAAARLRTSISWVTAWARPTSNCSRWAMRLSSVLATRIACVPSVLSISAARSPIRLVSSAPRVSMTLVTSLARSLIADVSFSPRASITPVTSAIRLSTAVTTSRPPSVNVFAISRTRADNASFKVAVRVSSVCWKLLNRSSSPEAISLALAVTRLSKLST